MTQLVCSKLRPNEGPYIAFGCDTISLNSEWFSSLFSQTVESFTFWICSIAAASSFVFYFFSLHHVWHLGTLVPPTRGWTHTPLQWKPGVLTTGPPGKFLAWFLLMVSPPMITYLACFLCKLELKVWFKLNIWGKNNFFFGVVYRPLHPSRSSSSVYPTVLLLKVVTELSWQQYDASMGTSIFSLCI